jgi:hypothetical protein
VISRVTGTSQDLRHKEVASAHRIAQALPACVRHDVGRLSCKLKVVFRE